MVPPLIWYDERSSFSGPIYTSYDTYATSSSGTARYATSSKILTSEFIDTPEKKNKDNIVLLHTINLLKVESL